MDKSLLRIYSLGYVAEDYVEDNPFLNVVPIEDITDITGNLTDSVLEENENIDNDNKIEKTIKQKGYTVRAKWFNLMEPNRLTAPNLCKGETVILWRYANSDIYLWTNMYNELDKRKLEKATYVFSNKRSIAGDINAVYYFTIDTINKRIRLHTDASDGELTTYDIDIDTKNGIFTIIDGKDNQIELDSANDKLTITINKDIEMNAPNIVSNSENFTINTKNYTLNSENDTINSTTSKHSTTSSTLTATSRTLNTSTVDINGGTIKHDGIAIDNTHQHTGNLGRPTSPPN